MTGVHPATSTIHSLYSNSHTQTTEHYRSVRFHNGSQSGNRAQFPEPVHTANVLLHNLRPRNEPRQYYQRSGKRPTGR